MIFFLCLLTICLLPLYLWKSGLPQIAHIMGVLWMLTLLVKKPVLSAPRVLVLGFAFAVYTGIVNLIVYALYLDRHSLLSAFYYVYNVSIFAAVIETARRVEFQNFFPRIVYGSILLLIIELFIVMFGLGRVMEGVRATGTFNDPNQMAHWVIWTVLIITLGGWYLKRGFVLGWFALIGGVILLVFSASRSGLLGMGWIFVVLTLMVLFKTLLTFPSFKFKLHRMASLLSVLVLIGFLGGNALLIFQEAGLLEKMWTQTQWYLERIRMYINIEKSYIMEERAYDRLVKFPEYLILGAGEGANERWGEGPVPEIHSTLAGVLFYYGIPGTFSLLGFLYLIWSSLPKGWQKLLLLAPFLYSLGTYNLRNTMFWVGLAVFFALGQAVKASHAETKTA